MNNQEQEKTNTEDASAPITVITENERHWFIQCLIDSWNQPFIGDGQDGKPIYGLKHCLFLAVCLLLPAILQLIFA